MFTDEAGRFNDKYGKTLAEFKIFRLILFSSVEIFRALLECRRYILAEAVVRIFLMALSNPSVSTTVYEMFRVSSAARAEDGIS